MSERHRGRMLAVQQQASPNGPRTRAMDEQLRALYSGTPTGFPHFPREGEVGGAAAAALVTTCSQGRITAVARRSAAAISAQRNLNATGTEDFPPMVTLRSRPGSRAVTFRPLFRSRFGPLCFSVHLDNQGEHRAASPTHRSSGAPRGDENPGRIRCLRSLPTWVR